MNAPVPALPRFVQIEPVGECNLACRMCPVSLREDGRPDRIALMPLPRFRRLLDQFPALTELHLQGIGEPLMHPRFFELVALAHARGIQVSTNSNLTLMSARRAAECVASGLSRLHVSIDAATPACYEAIRVGARFGRLMRGIERVLEACARSGSGPRIEFVAVLMRMNLGELPALVELAARVGVPALSVQQLAHDCAEDALPARYSSLRSFIAAQAPGPTDAPAIAAAFDAARAAAARTGVTLRLPAVSHGGRRGCDWPWRGAYRSYRGDAMPCCMVATPDRVNFGNMAVSGVDRVWGNAAYQAFRHSLDSDEPPEICRGCAVYAGRF